MTAKFVPIVTVLERVAAAKDGIQFKQIMAGYYTMNKEYPEVTQKLRLIEEIWLNGRKNR